MKFKEAFLALGIVSIFVMSINIIAIVNSVILVFVGDGLVSSIHPNLPKLSFFNAVGLIVIAYIVQGKFSITINTK